VRTNDLRVLDLTAADVQAHLGIKPEELLGDDY